MNLRSNSTRGSSIVVSAAPEEHQGRGRHHCVGLGYTGGGEQVELKIERGVRRCGILMNSQVGPTLPGGRPQPAG